MTTDRDVAEQAAKLMEAAIYARRPPNPNHKRQFVVVKNGRAARDLMRVLHPLLSARRREAVKAALESYTPKPLGPRRALSFQEASEVREMLAADCKPSQIVAAFAQRGRKITRYHVRTAKTGYREPQPEPALGPAPPFAPA